MRTYALRRRSLFALIILMVLGALLVTRPRATHADNGEFIIVSMGDSIASGEGAPEAGRWWQDAVCHRSSKSGPAQAYYDSIQVRFPNTSFFNVACSGAGIDLGLIRNQPARGGSVVPAQIDQVKNWMRNQKPGKRIDALLLSIGANDLGGIAPSGLPVGFAGTVSQCIADDPDVPMSVPGAPFAPVRASCFSHAELTNSLRPWLEGSSPTLASWYDQLASRIRTELNPIRVFITTYPDVARKSATVHCSGEPFGDALSRISRGEAEWGTNYVLANLNLRLKEAAARHGWQVVDVSPAFIGHGYCAGANRWINTAGDSNDTQGDLYGTMHPNATGYRVYGERLAGALFSYLRAPFDYDSDAKSDVAVWRPSEGYWYLTLSTSGSASGRQWGTAGDVPVPADYNGDGKTDTAVWRPSEGYWYVIDSGTGAFRGRQLGTAGDVPVPADYDADGKADFAVWRPSSGTWFIIRSADGSQVTRQWGTAGDKPVPGDYDGDGKADMAVWRPSSGTWFIIDSATGNSRSRQLGAAGDVPVPGDYDGDRKTDIAVWRPAGGNWYVIRSSDGSQVTRQWGTTGDVPVPGDYDGDGRTDYVVWRPAGGVWFIVDSKTGATRSRQWGTQGDIPV